MYKIALYNFSQNDSEIITTLLERYRDYTDTRLTISTFSSGFELNSTKETFHIAFIDVSKERESSLAIAREFLRRHSSAALVIIADSIDYFQDGYRVGAERYFVKPLVDDHFFTEMRSVFESVAHHLGAVRINDRLTDVISIELILYVETDNRKVKFCTTEGVFYSRETFAYWHDYFRDSTLILCSRGCLVNLQHVLTIEATTLLLEQGHRVPLSRRLRTSVIKRFVRFKKQ